MPPCITFYKSSLCPRCLLARRELQKLRRKFAWLVVEEVDVVVQPRRAWNAGIRMIPALQAGDEILAGIFLDKKRIRRFVVNYLDRLPPE